MHSLVGLAAVLIATRRRERPHGLQPAAIPIPAGNRIELFLGTFIGAMTFSGSIIAFGKLAGLGNKFRLFSSAPVVFKGQQMVNLLMFLAMIGFGIAFFVAAPGGAVAAVPDHDGASRSCSACWSSSRSAAPTCRW